MKVPLLLQMGLSRFIWGVIITLLQVPAGIDAGIVLDPRETIISEPSIAFLIHDLDGFGGSPHAIHAVQSLIKVGGWKGTIVFVTTCPNKRHLSALFDNNKVWIKQLPHMSQSSKRLLNSTHTRFAESFRFMPPEVTTVIMLDSFVFVADSLNEFIWWVYEHIQNKLRTFSGPASFIAAFAHEVTYFKTNSMKNTIAYPTLSQLPTKQENECDHLYCFPYTISNSHFM